MDDLTPFLEDVRSRNNYPLSSTTYLFDYEMLKILTKDSNNLAKEMSSGSINGNIISYQVKNPEDAAYMVDSMKAAEYMTVLTPQLTNFSNPNTFNNTETSFAPLKNLAKKTSTGATEGGVETVEGMGNTLKTSELNTTQKLL